MRLAAAPTPPRHGQGKPIVLHVSEAFGGGIVSALTHYAGLTRDAYAHHLVARIRDGHLTCRGFGTEFDDVAVVGGSLAQFARALRRTACRLRPDVIHLHSTWAGTIGRAVLPRWARIVYSPHCFGFERRDLGPVARLAVRAIEEALAPRHVGIAAIGAHEAALARGLKLNRRTWVVPNSVSIEPAPVADTRSDGRLCVGMVGRTAPQKGVDFFIESVRRLPPDRFRALWIGGGDEAGQRALRAAGIEVTGWIPRAEVLTRLATEVDLYLHTARWEGTPITLLEAAALGLPIVCRDIDHLGDVPVSVRVSCPEAAAAAVARMGDPAERARGRVANARILAQFSPQHTRAALLSAYAECRHASRTLTPRRDAGLSTEAQPLLQASSPRSVWTWRPSAR